MAEGVEGKWLKLSSLLFPKKSLVRAGGAAPGPKVRHLRACAVAVAREDKMSIAGAGCRCAARALVPKVYLRSAPENLRYIAYAGWWTRFPLRLPCSSPLQCRNVIQHLKNAVQRAASPTFCVLNSV